MNSGQVFFFYLFSFVSRLVMNRCLVKEGTSVRIFYKVSLVFEGYNIQYVVSSGKIIDSFIN